MCVRGWKLDRRRLVSNQNPAAPHTSPNAIQLVWWTWVFSDNCCLTTCGPVACCCPQMCAQGMHAPALTVPLELAGYSSTSVTVAPACGPPVPAIPVAPDSISLPDLTVSSSPSQLARCVLVPRRQPPAAPQARWHTPSFFSPAPPTVPCTGCSGFAVCGVWVCCAMRAPVSVVPRFLMAVSSDPTNAALHLRGLTVLAEVRTA